MIEKQKITESSAKNTPERNSSSVAGLSSGPTTLPDDVLEKLYRSYSLKQKRSGLTCFIAASIVFDLWAIVVPQGQSIDSLGKILIISYELHVHNLRVHSGLTLIPKKKTQNSYPTA